MSVLKKSIISRNVSYVIEFGHKYIRFYANHGLLLRDSGDVFEIESPYLNDEVDDIKTIQGGDYVYIFHPNHPIKTLMRMAFNLWILGDFTLKDGPWDPVNTSEIGIKASGETGEITLTAGGDVFSATDVGRLVRLTVYDSNTRHWTSKTEVKDGEIRISDNKYYEAVGVAEGTKTGDNPPNHTEGTRTDGSVQWTYLHAGYGVARIKSVQDAKNATAEVLSRMPDEVVSNPTVYWELGLLHPGKYPMAGAFFRRRFAFMVDDNGIPKVCHSCSDDYNNFADKSFGEVTAENAFTVPVTSSQYNVGKWLCASDVLFVGTGTGEFYIDVASSNSPLAPDNVVIKQISSIGSARINPVKVGAHILFVTASGNSFRDIVYSYENDTYDPIDLSIYGKHLLQSGIVDMEYQEYPDKIVWFALKDGRLAAMTFLAEQKVFAMHQHYLGGDVKSLAVIPNPDNTQEDLWVEISRTVQNKELRSIEWMDNGIVTLYPEEIRNMHNLDEKEKAEMQYMKENAFFADGALTWERKTGSTATKLTGLEHLEGKEVVIMADGAECERQIVSGGSIAINATANRVMAGLPIESAYIPQTIYIPGNNGSGIGDVQRIDHVTLMLWRTLGGKIGKNFENLQDIYLRLTDDAMNDSAPLYTGNKEIPVSFNTSTIKEKGATVLIYNDSVFPMNILAIVPHMTVSGNGL